MTTRPPRSRPICPRCHRPVRTPAQHPPRIGLRRLLSAVRRDIQPCPHCLEPKVLAFYDRDSHLACADCTGNEPAFACKRCGIDVTALRARVLRDELMWSTDVYERTPVELDDPILGRANVIHTPGVARRTRDANYGCADVLVENLTRVLLGGLPWPWDCSGHPRRGRPSARGDVSCCGRDGFAADSRSPDRSSPMVRTPVLDRVAESATSRGPDSPGAGFLLSVVQVLVLRTLVGAGEGLSAGELAAATAGARTVPVAPAVTTLQARGLVRGHRRYGDAGQSWAWSLTGPGQGAAQALRSVDGVGAVVAGDDWRGGRAGGSGGEPRCGRGTPFPG